jgi:hypothetical protein
VLDETCAKINGLEYWVYAALDVDRNEILSMRVYSSEIILPPIIPLCKLKHVLSLLLWVLPYL